MRLLAFCLIAGLFLPPLANAQAGGDESAIRQLRASSNAAIARHDTAGVGAMMAQNVVVVTSRSVQTTGRADNVRAFADQFRDRPDVVYERLPIEVRVFEPWGMASERGAWTGSWTDATGKIRIGGAYFAKWRKVNGSWFVESETYVPEQCTGGSFCRTPP